MNEFELWRVCNDPSYATQVEILTMALILSVVGNGVVAMVALRVIDRARRTHSGPQVGEGPLKP